MTKKVQRPMSGVDSQRQRVSVLVSSSQTSTKNKKSEDVILYSYRAF